MKTGTRRTAILALISAAACAGGAPNSRSKPTADLSTYKSTVVPAVTTSVQGNNRAESEHFAAVLRGALTREIDGGGKLKALAYPGADLTGTAVFHVDVESLNRDAKGANPVVRWSIVDASTKAVIRPSGVTEVSIGMRGGDRFDGRNSLTWAAESIAQEICRQLGIAGSEQPGSWHSRDDS